MKHMKQMVSLLTATTLAVTGFAFDCSSTPLHASAASYPVQEFRMGIANTDRNVNISAAENGAPITSAQLNGTDAEEWTLNYIAAGIYEIVNVESGLLLTADASGYCTVTTDADNANQRWNIVAVEQDFEGYDLYYKITSNADNSKALTFSPENNSFTADAYSGETYQKYKLNLNGLEGFAANCMTENGQKAGTIGGLLGETVFVDTVEDCVAAMKRTEPLTIVVTANLEFNSQPQEDQKIEDDKTILGSYGANIIYNSRWRNDDFYGDTNIQPSNNIVLQNLHFRATELNSNGCGVILIYIYCGRNIWFDHNDFSASFAHDKDNEVGKFIWINTPVDNWSDGCYNGISPDYITLSYNHFNNRFWTVAYGTQNTETTRDRTTLLFNKWENCARRTPQIGNGTGHVLNNYYTYTISDPSQQIIAGDGCKMLTEYCYFEGLSGLEFAGGGASNSPMRDTGSVSAKDTNSAASALNKTFSYSHDWQPGTENYGYSLVSANNTKSFCNNYAGSVTADGQMQFITDAALQDQVMTTYKTPFLEEITVGALSIAKEGTALDTDLQYAFRNYGSNLYLEVADGVAAAGSNVQQGGSTISTSCTWSLKDGGNGYYYVISALGDGVTYYLDLENGAVDNGTNIAIWTDTASDAQLFKFVANSDGTYQIVTKASRDASGLGIVAGSTDTGANVVQWKYDGAANQCWVIEPIIAPISGSLISALEKKDLDYYAAWNIDTDLQTGDLVFGDREVTFATIPEVLIGSELILTACDSKFTTTDLAVVTAAEDIRFYVGFDARLSTIPAWAANFTKTNLTCTSSNDVTFVLYQTEIAAGQSITLGAQGTSAGVVNYIAIASTYPETTTTTPEPSTLKIGDVNCDGEVKVNDVILLNRFLSEDETAVISAQGMRNAECDNVDGITNNDAIAILKILAGL